MEIETAIDSLDLGVQGHVTKIVTAYLANNQVAIQDLPGLIQMVSMQIQEIAHPTPTTEAPAKAEPAVPVRRSIQPDSIVCLVCGKRQKMLKRHIARHHNLTPEQYRTMFELKPDYPMVAPDYAAHRSDLAKKIGLGTRDAKAGNANKPTAPEKPTTPTTAKAAPAKKATAKPAAAPTKAPPAPQAKVKPAAVKGKKVASAAAKMPRNIAV